MTNYKNLYDDLYSSGYHSETDLSHSKVFFERILRFTETIDKPKILDVGCAIGNAVLYFQKQGLDTYGADISSVATDRCAQRGIKNCYPYPADDLRFDDESFDVVLCTEVMEHLEEEKDEKSVNEIARVCKSKGRVYLRLHLRPEANRTYDKIANKHDLQNLHVNLKTEDQWLSIIEKHFERVEKFLDNNGSLFFIGDKK